MARGELDARQKLYAQNRSRGLGKKAAATLAGYSETNGAGAQVEESEDVAEYIARLQAETAANAGITKDMVAQGLVEAAALAKTLADPTGMVAAWRELGKLLGHYAPEVKKIEKGINKKDLKAAIEDMSDDELRRLSRGRVIEGQFERIPSTPAPQLPDLSQK